MKYSYLIDFLIDLEKELPSIYSKLSLNDTEKKELRSRIRALWNILGEKYHLAISDKLPEKLSPHCIYLYKKDLSWHYCVTHQPFFGTEGLRCNEGPVKGKIINTLNKVRQNQKKEYVCATEEIEQEIKSAFSEFTTDLNFKEYHSLYLKYGKTEDKSYIDSLHEARHLFNFDIKYQIFYQLNKLNSLCKKDKLLRSLINFDEKITVLQCNEINAEKIEFDEEYVSTELSSFLLEIGNKFLNLRIPNMSSLFSEIRNAATKNSSLEKFNTEKGLLCVYRFLIDLSIHKGPAASSETFNYYQNASKKAIILPFGQRYDPTIINDKNTYGHCYGSVMSWAEQIRDNREKTHIIKGKNTFEEQEKNFLQDIFSERASATVFNVGEDPYKPNFKNIAASIMKILKEKNECIYNLGWKSTITGGHATGIRKTNQGYEYMDPNFGVFIIKSDMALLNFLTDHFSHYKSIGFKLKKIALLALTLKNNLDFCSANFIDTEENNKTRDLTLEQKKLIINSPPIKTSSFFGFIFGKNPSEFDGGASSFYYDPTDKTETRNTNTEEITEEPPTIKWNKYF